MSIEKLEACIAYVCGKQTQAQAPLDHIKLNKVLWYADTSAYLSSGKSITASRYVRKPRGPVAKYMSAAVNRMVADGRITKGKWFDPKAGYWTDTYELTDTPNGDADDRDISVSYLMTTAMYDEPEADERVELSADERAALDRSYRAVAGSDSMALSERTHGDIWELAADGEDIPLYAIWSERLGKVTAAHIRDLFPNS